MSSKNDETTAMAGAIGFILAGFIILAAVMFAVAAFCALIFTVLCLLAWNKPLTIFGMILPPEEARACVYGGLAGTFLLPTFVAFCSILFNLGIPDNYWFYLFVGGYVCGCLGVSHHIAEVQNVEAANDILLPSLPAPMPHPAKLLTQKPERFEFASWDDEEDSK